MKRAQCFQHPFPNAEEQVRPALAVAGKLRGRAEVVEQREEEEREAESIGGRVLGLPKGVESGGEFQEFLPPLFPAQRLLERGKKGEKHSRFDHQAHGLPGRAFPEFPQKFVTDPGRGTEPDFFHVGKQGPVGDLFDGKSGSGGVTDYPDHSNGVLDEFFFRVSDAPDHAPAKVFESPHMVHEGKVGQIIENSINGNIPAEGVFDGRAERVFRFGLVSPVAVGVIKRIGAPAESGDLDVLAPGKIDMGKAEAASDQAGVAEELPNLPGLGVGGHIKIFRSLSQEEVPNASPDQVGRESVVVKPVKDPQGIRIDTLSGYGVLLTRENQRRGREVVYGLKLWFRRRAKFPAATYAGMLNSSCGPAKSRTLFLPNTAPFVKESVHLAGNDLDSQASNSTCREIQEIPPPVTGRCEKIQSGRQKHLLLSRGR
jgi:hypothetical protein